MGFWPEHTAAKSAGQKKGGGGGGGKEKNKKPIQTQKVPASAQRSSLLARV